LNYQLFGSVIVAIRSCFAGVNAIGNHLFSRVPFFSCLNKFHIGVNTKGKGLALACEAIIKPKVLLTRRYIPFSSVSLYCFFCGLALRIAVCERHDGISLA
jgi:hypothetical protein